jgi:hypothetical protein
MSDEFRGVCQNPKINFSFVHNYILKSIPVAYPRYDLHGRIPVLYQGVGE